MALRVKVIFDQDVWRVDLPEYNMVPDSFLPVIEGITTSNGVLPGVDPDLPALASLSCLVDVPERIIDPQTGDLDIGAINALYRGNPQWGDTNLTLNI